jgi:hypothetical protein
MENNTRGIITIAVGKKFIRQAKYLALSCVLHYPQIPRAVITDGSDLEKYFDIIIPYRGDFGNPFSLKTKLDIYSPFENTLYIDSDCMVYTGLEAYWDDLSDRLFSYFGTILTSGDWYETDINEILKKTGINWLPQFNSGMFLFKKDAVTSKLFEHASNLQQSNDIDIPFFRKDMLPDEPFLAVSLSKYDQKPVIDHGRYARSLIDVRMPKIDVIKGIAQFIKFGKTAHPGVVHFAGEYCKNFYLREKIKIFLYFHTPLDYFIINIISNCIYFSAAFYRTLRHFIGTTLRLKYIIKYMSKPRNIFGA